MKNHGIESNISALSILDDSDDFEFSCPGGGDPKIIAYFILTLTQI